jgi:hypothetical protein
MIKIMRLMPNAKCEIKSINPGYKALQDEVDGILTTAVVCKKWRDAGITCYVDDESILKGKPLTLYCDGEEPYDLHGNLILVGTDELGNDISLTEEQIGVIDDTLLETQMSVVGSYEIFEVFVVRSEE